MKRLRNYSLGIALAIFFAASAFAQPNGEMRGVDPARRQEIMQKILEHKHAKLREVLNLDKETAQKFFDIYTPAEQELAKLVAERTAMEIKLLKLTRGDYTDADVDPTLAEIERLNDVIKDRFSDLNDSLKPILTPRQRARLAVFEHEFNRRVREKIKEHRKGPDGPGRPPQPPPGGGKPKGPRGPHDPKRGPR